MNTTTSLRTRLIVSASVLAAACGGGGGGGGATPEPTVTSMSTTTAVRYSDTMTVTLNGANLDAGLAVSSAGCKSMAISTTAPNVSNATTAYYTCTVSAIGAQTVSATRSSDGAALQSANFNVAVPQVTMNIVNSANPATFTGSMLITLAPDKAPITVDNFLRYVKDGFYPNTIIHRSSPGFVIQGGAYRLPGSAPKGTFGAIALEVNKGLSNLQGTVAMARAGGQPNSATSQFFVNLVNNSGMLDPRTPASPSDDAAGYAVFGTVTTGTSVPAAIATSPCGIFSDIPLPPGDCTPNPLMIITSAVQTQ